jgi:hypothetical protein
MLLTHPEENIRATGEVTLGLAEGVVSAIDRC